MNRKTNRLKYINNFPIIIMVAVAIIIIILINVYLNFKPYKTIYSNGYMVLSNNMTYNLINNNTMNDNLNVGAILVKNGDEIYKQLDSYFVGTEDKKEIDYNYPMYSTDGLTIFNTNEDTTLINRNFEKLKGYSGLSLNYGILYNEGDPEPADDIDYLFLSLNNNIYINVQVMTIRTLNNEYNISINSPCYFDKDYVNYYIFDGKSFNYQRIDDIYYDSLIKIGDVTLSYEEFLIKMGILKISNEDSADDIIIEEEKPVEEKPLDQEKPYVLPVITVGNFNSNVYSISSNLSILDTSNIITTAPTFELYIGDKLYSRKKISNSGDFNISGLSANTEYTIIGKYKYRDKNGIVLEKEFFNNKIKTKSIDLLDPIQLKSEAGPRHSNQLEIQNLKIENIDIEAISGVKRVFIDITENGSSSTKTYDLSYSQLTSLLKGNKIDILTSNVLETNTTYTYNIVFHDKDSNVLKVEGNISGMFQTSKAIPYISYTSSIDKKNNKVTINLLTVNKDNVYIENYKYILKDSIGNLIEEKQISSYTNGSVNTLQFNELDYNKNYIVNITGIYDLSDGNGEYIIDESITFTTANLSSDFVAYYDTTNLEVNYNSIKSDIYVSSRATVLQKQDTKLTVYLTNSEGNDILNEDGSLKYSETYNAADLEVASNGYYKISQSFFNLESNSEYNIKLKIVVKQIEKDIELLKTLTPSIKTTLSDAFIEVNYKRLLGSELDLSFKVNDYDNLISNNQVIVEIYNGNYQNINDITAKSIYREVKKIKDSNGNSQSINITLNNFNDDEYTVLISANPYNNTYVKKYLDIKGNLLEYSNCINISRSISVKTQMYQQREINKKLNTEIQLEYDLKGFEGLMLAVDCTDFKCRKIGYLHESAYDEINQKSIISFLSIDSSKYSYDYKDDKLIIKNDKKDINHKFYLTVEKAESEFNINESFDPAYINILYELTSLEYNTAEEIYNIDEVSDFYDRNLMPNDTSTKKGRKYVVTKNLDFYDPENNKSLIINNGLTFNGTIDFQGHNLDIYITNDYNSESLFYTIYSSGIIENLKLNYHLKYDGVLKIELKGFITSNYGNINNVVVTVEQENEYGRAPVLNLITRHNYGVIKNFVAYLKSNIHLYSSSTASSLLMYSNSGTVKNGYISKDPNSDLINTDIILHDEKAVFGTFVYTNGGVVKNLYNLINVLSAESSYKGSGLATICYSSNKNATIKNTLSDATTTKYNNNGPNVVSGNVSPNASNNYYIDRNNNTFVNRYNSKINSSSLTNPGTFDIILNDEKAFINTIGYYPLIEMSQFMLEYQKLIPLNYDYKNSRIDIISSKAINDNINETGIAKVELSINNPNNYTITNITMEDVTVNIEKNSQVWDEATQITKLNLELKDPKHGSDSYNITSIEYKNFIGNKETKEYTKPNIRTVNIRLFKFVDNYDDLIKSINENDNIYLLNNITATSDALPIASESKPYTGVFDGNNKKLDFKNKIISRGYFIYYFYGTLLNLQITNLYIESSIYFGFICNSVNATFENINISDSTIKIKGDSSKYVGALSTINSNITVSRCSVNSISISKEGQTNLKDTYIGGILGSVSNSIIENSYVDMGDNKIELYLDTLSGYKTIGALVGKISGSTLNNNYTRGTIITDFSNVGGIYGTVSSSTIKNSYSYVDITTSGDYVGGIVGNILSNTTISNNMYVGKLYNLNNNYYFDSIAPLLFNNNNYSNSETFNYINTNTKQTITLMEFDVSGSYLQDNENPYSLPYLKNSSTFTEQSIRNEYINNESIVEYEINYTKNNGYELNQSTKEMIAKDNSAAELYSQALYDSATIEFTDNIIEMYSDSNELNIEKEDSTSSGISTYKLTPIKYKNSYTINIKTEEGQLIPLVLYDLSFYRIVTTEDDWKEIKPSENVILIGTNDNKNVIQVQDSNDITSKKIRNLLGNNITIKASNTLKNPLIYWNSGIMRDVEFSDILLEPISPTNDFGLISFNTGKILNCKFNNIEVIDYADNVGVIGSNTGYIDNITIEAVNVKGKNYVGGLVGNGSNLNSTAYYMTNIHGKDIKIYGSKYVGGLIGLANYRIKNIDMENIEIGPYETNNSIVVYPTNYIGGIAGSAYIDNSKIYGTNKIQATGKYIGGITGYLINYTSPVDYLSVENMTINDRITVGDKIIKPVNSSLVGGIIGDGYIYLRYSDVNNLIIDLTGDNIGGIMGQGHSVLYSNIQNSTIKGNSNIGGILGLQRSYATSLINNAVFNTTINSSNNVGGIVGKYFNTDGGSLNISYNTVASSKITSQSTIGGIAGYVLNNTDYSQTLTFYNNFVYDTTINCDSNDINVGGLIGYLYQIPRSTQLTFKDSLFNGKINGNTTNYGVGKIQQVDINSDSGYGGIINSSLLNEYTIENKFSIASNFKEFIPISSIDVNYQINKSTSLSEIPISKNYLIIPDDNLDDSVEYFPVVNRLNNLESKNYWVQLPDLSDEKPSLAANSSYMSRSLIANRLYNASTYSKPLSIGYDIYASDIDKINIEFSNSDSSTNFYYRIGNYESQHTSITSRTYTISYDFKNDLELYFTCNGNTKIESIKAKDLVRTVSLINDKTYYLDNGLLYSNDTTITGNFVNLYGNKALTDNGKLYNIELKSEENSNITYSIFNTSKPLYSFNYNGQIINTYYNYSTVDGSIKEYQLFVKNGVLNVINNNLNNDKSSYIFDYYNNINIQVILKDGKLYNLNGSINYPENLINNDIDEIYSNSNLNLAVLKYSNGRVYTFDYRTGKQMFDNSTNEYNGIFDYIKSKLFSSSSSNKVESITDYKKYSEIELLKNKIIDYSVEDATNKINNNNGISNSKNNYIVVYNQLTQNYGIYNTEDLLNKENYIESETDKIYRNYELVQFYNPTNKKANKGTLSGILLFTLSIIAVIISLGLLISRKRKQRYYV